MPASLFEARRNAPDAWGAYNISAGWVSDIDLYRHRQSFVLGALAAAEMRRNGEDMAPGQEKIMGSSLNRKWLQTVLSKGNDDSNIESGAKNLNVPIFMSGVDAVDYCKDPRLSAGALQLVQEEGDLILIPPRFWHQVYHLEPSIAVASQYMNDIGKNVTFNHILKWCQSSSVNGAEGRLSVNLLPRNFTSLSDREQVLSVIQTGLKLQHGRMKGSALMRRLMSDTEKKGTED